MLITYTSFAVSEYNCLLQILNHRRQSYELDKSNAGMTIIRQEYDKMSHLNFSII